MVTTCAVFQLTGTRLVLRSGHPTLALRLEQLCLLGRVPGMLYANALLSTLRLPHQRGVEASSSHRRTRPYSWQTPMVFLYAQSEKHQESDPELRTSKEMITALSCILATTTPYSVIVRLGLIDP
jgi:hypothetical protein